MIIDILEVNGVEYFTIDGPSIENHEKCVKYAINRINLIELRERCEYDTVIKFFMLVRNGLILSTHLFKGLNRYLYDQGYDGDEDKFVFSRKPVYDYVWHGGADGNDERIIAQQEQVFVVIVSPNKDKANFKDIEGWVVHWAWVDEDSILKGAPKDWIDRYDEKLWDRNI